LRQDESLLGYEGLVLVDVGYRFPSALFHAPVHLAEEISTRRALQVQVAL
jgi:hypothetical protein